MGPTHSHSTGNEPYRLIYQGTPSEQRSGGVKAHPCPASAQVPRQSDGPPQGKELQKRQSCPVKHKEPSGPLPFPQQLKALSRSIATESATPDPQKGLRSLVSIPASAASLLLQFDFVGVEQIEKTAALQNRVVKETGEKLVLREGWRRTVEGASCAQKSYLSQRSITAHDLTVPECVTRGLPFWRSGLSALAAQLKRTETTGAWGRSWINALTTYFHRDDISAGRLSLADLQSRHRELFSTAGHQNSCQYWGYSIGPGDLIAPEHKAANLAVMSLLEADSRVPGHTVEGLKEAHAVRQQQIGRYKLEPGYPTFVLCFNKVQGVRDGLPVLIPLSPNQALELAQMKATTAGDAGHGANCKRVKKMLEEIFTNMELQEWRGMPDSLYPDYAKEAGRDLDRMVAAFCANPSDILCFKTLPAKAVQTALAEQVTAFNEAMEGVTTLNELCDTLGQQIPRFIQIHPFGFGNRYYFAQLARYLLLVHGYPTALMPNFNAMGLQSGRELSAQLLMSVATYRLLSQGGDPALNIIDRSQKTSSFDVADDIAILARQLQEVAGQFGWKAETSTDRVVPDKQSADKRPSATTTPVSDSPQPDLD